MLGDNWVAGQTVGGGLCNFGKLLGKILKVGYGSVLLQSNVSVPLVLWLYMWVNRLSNLPKDSLVSWFG